MAANGHAFEGSVNSDNLRVCPSIPTPHKSLGYDNNRNLFMWNGSIDELQDFWVDELNLEKPKISSCERSTSLKTKGITFTLYSSTKTLQVQGSDPNEVKSRMKSFISCDQDLKAGEDDPELDRNNSDSSDANENDDDHSLTSPAGDEKTEIIEIPAVTKPKHRCCKECHVLRFELQKLRSDFENLMQRLNLPAPRAQPTVSTKNSSDRLQDEINQLQANNSSLISTVKVLANLVAGQPNVEEKDTTRRENQETRKKVDNNHDQNKPPTTDDDAPWEVVGSAKSKSKKDKKRKKNKGKQETMATPATSSRRPCISTDSPVTAILGDSTLKYINGNRLSKSLETKVHVKPFPGARVKDMSHYVIPSLEELKPTEVILHIGTNDLRDHEPREVAEAIVDLANEITLKKPGIGITYSEILTRGDNKELDSKGKSVNKLVKQFCSQNSWNVLTHNNILLHHLNQGGLHLNKVGNGVLAKNFISHLN